MPEDVGGGGGAQLLPIQEAINTILVYAEQISEGKEDGLDEEDLRQAIHQLIAELPTPYRLLLADYLDGSLPPADQEFVFEG